MLKKDIRIQSHLYYNTTGAYEKPISLKCEVLDVGKKFIWILIKGNLSPTPVQQSYLSVEPKYKVTNNFRG